MTHPLLEDNIRCIRHAILRLQGLSDETYTCAPCTPIGSSLGAQFRHILDHYTCLLRGVQAGVIDYDSRPRQKLIEQDRLCALDALQDASTGLASLSSADFERPLGIRLRAGEAAEHLLGVVPTSLTRELHFTMMHSVHHLAMISAELAARGTPCRDDLGLAPSTRAWRRSQR